MWIGWKARKIFKSTNKGCLARVNVNYLIVPFDGGGWRTFLAQPSRALHQVHSLVVLYLNSLQKGSASVSFYALKTLLRPTAVPWDFALVSTWTICRFAGQRDQGHPRPVRFCYFCIYFFSSISPFWESAQMTTHLFCIT